MTVRPLAVIVGCESLDFNNKEVEFFTKYNPFGLILFERNCRDQKQIISLTERFRGLVNRQDAPVLIDQEGGRVARLRPPNWKSMPPAIIFGKLFGKNIKAAEAAIKLNYRLIAEDLRLCGININCAPVIDLPIFPILSFSVTRPVQFAIHCASQNPLSLLVYADLEIIISSPEGVYSS